MYTVEKAYVVKYITGEYLDRSERVFVVFDSDLAVKDYCDKFNEFLRAAGYHYDQPSAPNHREFVYEGQTFPVDYTGAKVEWEMVPYISH